MVERSHTAGLWPNLYEPLKRATEKVAEWFAPRSEAAASSESYRISLELPGVREEDIEVSLQEDTLLVRGEKRSTHEEGDESYFFSECEYGAFQRSFRLPPDADADAAVADFKNGVLAISIPKKQARPEQGRRVPIRSE